MNRAQRRLAEKQKKKETISAQTRATNDRLHSYYQKQLNNFVDKYNVKIDKIEAELQKEREDNIENDWYWFYANLCLTLKEDYHKNNEYIAKFVDKVEQRLRRFKDSGTTRDELIKECQEKCDIILCSQEEDEE